METVVSDTGIGMSKDYLPKLFDEFSRERNVTENKIQGTGLGMPIVKRLVDLMGGTITVESEIGKGTSISVIIPLIQLLFKLEIMSLLVIVWGMKDIQLRNR